MNRPSRRSVLKNGAATAALLSMQTALPKALQAKSLAKSPGIQLYTVSKELSKIERHFGKNCRYRLSHRRKRGIGWKKCRRVPQGVGCGRTEVPEFSSVSDARSNHFSIS